MQQKEKHSSVSKRIAERFLLFGFILPEVGEKAKRKGIPATKKAGLQAAFTYGLSRGGDLSEKVRIKHGDKE